jgi:hypothetical protein
LHFGRFVVRMSRIMPKVLIDAGISIATIFLTICFEFVSMMIVQPARAPEFHSNPAAMLEFLGRPFDFWIVAFSIIVGAFVSSATTRTKLVMPAIGLGVVLLLILASIGMSAIYGGNWLKIYVPDLIAFGFVGYTVFAVH